MLDPSDSFITITLQRHPNDNTHKCFVFETSQKGEIGSLIASYCPSLAGWLTESEAPPKKVKSKYDFGFLTSIIQINFDFKLSHQLQLSSKDSCGFLK